LYKSGYCEIKKEGSFEVELVKIEELIPLK
jgi:hypothetical protein